MKRAIRRTIWILLAAISTTAGAQNLLQNSGFESPEGWDQYWILATEDPSSPSAMADAVTSDVVEGTRSVQLSNSVKQKWTYFYSDTVEAPITLRADKKYEVKGWIKVLEMGKAIDLSIFWNGSAESYQFFRENPDPEVQDDWFMVKDTIYPQVHCSDAYLRLGFRSDKDGLFPTGRLLLDNFSVTRIPEDTDTDITAFMLPDQAGETEIDYLNGTVRLILPGGTDLTSLRPVLIGVSEGAAISPSPEEPVDFSSAVTYTVTARDAITTQDWVVEVEVLPNSGTDILSFSLPGQIGKTELDAETASVSVVVATGTDISSLVPEISVSEGASIVPGSGIEKDFTSPVVYEVRAEDGTSSAKWTVTVTQALNQEADIMAFSLASELRTALSSYDQKTVVIDPGKQTVTVEVAYGTDVTGLIPDIEVSAGATLDPAGGIETDFSAPVIYQVTAQDGTTVKDWTVTVNVLANTEASITGFTLEDQLSPATIDQDALTVTLEVAPGTDLTSLIPAVTVSPGAIVTPSEGESVDCSSGAVYTVTAEDGTMKEWTVTILMDPAVSAAPGAGINEIRIYPNPANTHVLAEIALLSDLFIRDLRGKVVVSMHDVSGNITIPVSQLERGLYLVTVRTGTHRQVTKLIVE
jgi:hypothetical protein